MYDKLIYLVQSKSKALFIISAFLLLLFIVFLKPIPVNGNLEGFYMKDNPYYQSYLEMEQFYPYERSVQLLITPVPGCTIGELIKGMDSLQHSLELMYEGSGCFSLSDAKRIFRNEILSGESAINVINRFRDDPVFAQAVSDNSEMLLMVLQVPDSTVIRVDDINMIIGSNYPGIRSIGAMSRFHVEAEIENSIRKDLMLISLVVALIIISLVLLIYRSLITLMIILCNGLFSLIPLVLLFNIFGVQLNMVTVIAIPVVLIMSLSDSIHIITGYYHRIEIADREERIRKTIKRFMFPSFLTSATTALAFMSFLLNDSVYIREFGLVVGTGVIIEFIFTFLTIPYLLGFVKQKNISFTILSGITGQLIKYQKPVAIILFCSLIISPFFLGKLRFQTDFSAFFPLNSEIRSTHEKIRSQFESLFGLDISITKKSFTEEDVSLKEYTAGIVKELGAIDGVTHVNSFLDRLRFEQRHRAGSYRRELQRINQLYIRDNVSRIHVSVNDPAMIQDLKKEIDKMAAASDSKFEFNIYSTALLFDYINNMVARSLLRSLLFSGLAIFLIFILLSRSLRNSLVSIVANLVPMGILVLLFTAFNIPVNIGTAITAVICLGLIVDDTIHILYCRLILKKDISQLGTGLLATSILLFLCFFTFGLSDFQPTRTFGLLSAIVFLVTYASDISVINWLLKTEAGKGPKS